MFVGSYIDSWRRVVGALSTIYIVMTATYSARPASNYAAEPHCSGSIYWYLRPTGSTHSCASDMNCCSYIPCSISCSVRSVAFPFARNYNTRHQIVSTPNSELFKVQVVSIGLSYQLSLFLHAHFWSCVHQAVVFLVHLHVTTHSQNLECQSAATASWWAMLVLTALWWLDIKKMKCIVLRAVIDGWKRALALEYANSWDEVLKG